VEGLLDANDQEAVGTLGLGVVADIEETLRACSVTCGTRGGKGGEGEGREGRGLVRLGRNGATQQSRRALDAPKNGDAGKGGVSQHE
jgi:hypothetical protein